LPILFAAGMSLMDTTDGVLMVKAYNWAFVNPLRKIFYNLTTTCLSIVVALVIGSIELLQVLIGLLRLKGPFYDYVSRLDFGVLGYVILGIFLLVWGIAAALWKGNRIEESHDRLNAPHAHNHTHAGGVTHAHEHFH
jgi:high-affinity nickel-transport protein